MNPFAISALLTGLTSLFLGIFVLFKSRGSKINKIWSVFCFSVAIWGFGSLKVALTLDAVQALFWWKVTYIGIIFIPIFYHHFVHEFLKIKSKILLYSFYIYGFFYVIIEWTHLDYLFFNINNITLYFDSLYFVYPPTFLFLFFVFSWFGIIIYSHIELYRAFKNSYGLGREQIKYFFIGMVVAFAGGGTCYLPCFGVALYPYLNFAGPFYPAVITYAIVRHRLLDIKVVLRRSTVYLASVLTIILPAIFLLYFADKHYPGLIILVSLTALVIGISIFTPIRNFFYRLANKYFFSSLYDSREVISALADKLRSTLEAYKIFYFIADTLKGAFHSRAVGILIYDEKNGRYLVQYNDGFEVNGKRFFPSDRKLQETFVRQNKTLVVEELDVENFKESKPTIELLKSLGVEILAPLNVKDKTIGLIALGGKESRDMYNSEDLRVLEIVGAQAAISIENALLYEETKNFATTLKLEVEKATAELRAANEELKKLDKAKSDFISIASHQLRAPLTAIKGFTSMILEGSYGSLEGEVRDKMEKVFESAERLINLVDDLLDLSHMEGGKMEYSFSKVDFGVMAQSVIEELNPQAQKKNLSLEFKKPVETCWVWADEQKLRQVVTNLVDNAIKYTEKGGVKVSLEKTKGYLQLTIKDTGVGMNQEEIANLFQKFVRGPHAPRLHTEGAGIGLYVAKQLIEAQKGQVWVESEGEGKGSMFFVKVPEHKR